MGNLMSSRKHTDEDTPTDPAPTAEKQQGGSPVLSRIPSLLSGVDVWDWGIGRASNPETPEPSVHGGNALQPPPARSASALWDWGADRSPDPNVTPAPSRESSVHGGGGGALDVWNWGHGRPPSLNATPAPSREGSRHGSVHGMSFWNWGAGRPNDPSAGSTPNPSAAPSRNNSVHGGGILRNANWPAPSLSPVSRGNSAHGGACLFCEPTLCMHISFAHPSLPSLAGVHFAKLAIEAGKERETMSRRNSFTDLWHWGFGREDPDPLSSSESDSPRTTSPPPERADAMERRDSIGTSLWSWSLGREEAPPFSPSASRESSVHNGSMGNGEGKTMPWAIKLKFGTDSERPV